MRFLLDARPSSLSEAVAAAAAAVAGGLDGIVLGATPGMPDPLLVAAAVAGSVDDALLAVDVAVGDRHPLEVAEESLVVDQVSRGRLILVAAPARGAEDAFPEAVDLLRAAWTPRPFRAAGPRWIVPAGLPEHLNDVEERVRVTPAPFGARLELWLGDGGAVAAAERGLGHIAAQDAPGDELGRIWLAAGPAAATAPRARREAWTTPDALLARLREGRASFGQDWAVVRAAATDARAIGAQVRPRMQLDGLPEGLEAHWDDVGP